MEDTGIITVDGRAGKDGNQEADNTVLLSGKPLHRFVQKEPRNLGIVILMFGCAELLMGFQLSADNVYTSNRIYIPFWQGALFLVCGVLSIYTELHPSKKMVTICLSMYVVSILGIIVSLGYRIHCFVRIPYYYYMYSGDFGESYQLEQVISVEGILFTSSLCVSGLLIFLSVIARFALKSTHTQLIVHHISSPQSDTTPN
ncbi:membrane-spanning 4-domains subfamily A member 4D-like [Cololabis saira]|uniref:membrane-spanning 4-domains subfamily A member 4D-like n=1 Tax=Cololabis saira TaxID=129043 RepID=UPI002AD1FFBB|nr:membrane-spanning 4-domains subfamily A member 4D-like [Cololabis saira]XP_061582262.1 membrane-spanning 4-domains subfamily A member 4D-like [Cololabis saira]XP_061582263.1 membrane-spanning 4-domains subfamily A member 4D-like [Cololabis saira]